jgi:polyphosphate kinase
VPGLSENIRVQSVVGRFLEHSRIYYFANGGADDIYMGSADMMHRNLDRRVEVLVRPQAKKLKRRLLEILELGLADNAGAWSLGADGDWQRVRPGPDAAMFGLQQELMRRATISETELASRPAVQCRLRGRGSPVARGTLDFRPV